MAEKKKADQWSTRWGLILACIGMAVGTGNIWRFPRVAASQGGGAFILVVMIGLFLWAIPCMMAEAVWGKVTRMGVIGSFKEFVGRKWTWMGTVVAAISLGIAFYYAVVVGWCVRYFVYALSGVIKPGLDSEALWTAFSTTPGATGISWSCSPPPLSSSRASPRDSRRSTKCSFLHFSSCSSSSLSGRTCSPVP